MTSTSTKFAGHAGCNDALAQHFWEEFRVRGSGFKIQSAECRVQGAGFSEGDLALALFQLLEYFDEFFVRQHCWSPHPGLPG